MGKWDDQGVPSSPPPPATEIAVYGVAKYYFGSMDPGRVCGPFGPIVCDL